MKIGIFLKFILLFSLMAIALGTVGIFSYKNYRQQHYEGVASAQLATAVVGAAAMLNAGTKTGKESTAETLSLFGMFPFLLCVEMKTAAGDTFRWPPLPCDIIKEKKYSLDYKNVLADGGDLRFYISRLWVEEEVNREVRLGIIGMALFLVCFLLGSAIVFHRVVGHPVGFLVDSLRGVSRDLSKQRLIKKLSKDEIGELTDTLNSLLGRIREYQSELIRLANTDGLTGILNRRTFFSKSEHLLSEHDNSIFFVQIDLDHFKSVNDNYGHGIGDQVLELVGHLLQGSVRTVGEREPDLVGRLGGEEFGILLSTESIEQALLVTERLRTTLEQSQVETGGNPLTVTGSFGIAEARPEESIDNLYHRADMACYEAKENGRNRVVVAK
ncbi:GGDEF domain-containing protein [Arenicellales bacterium nBUS_45]